MQTKEIHLETNHYTPSLIGTVPRFERVLPLSPTQTPTFAPIAGLAASGDQVGGSFVRR